jgi:hypothetical protein
MNEPMDSFESELANLRPVAPSSQLRAQAAACGVFACVLIAIAVQTTEDNARQITLTPGSPTDSLTFLDTQAPTLWSYRRSLCESMGAFDERLERQAGAMSRNEPVVVSFDIRWRIGERNLERGEL